MVGLFFISTKYDLMRDYPFFKFINLIVIFSFPFFFIYSSYGYTYIPQQIFFSSFITIFYQLITVGLLYAVYFLSLNIILPESILSEISEYLPYLFLLIIITFSTNLRNLLINGLEYISAKKNRKLNHSLEEMIRLISSPVSMKVSIDKLVRIAMNALEVQKVVILITDERIKSTQKATPFIMKISRQSGIWKYLANETEITITSHLAYGAGYREQVFNFLDNMKIHLAYPIFGIEGLDEPSTVFLFGEKRNKRNFSIAELKFMKEFAKLGDMMLQNYLLLISEIEKKRLEKDIELASLQQRTMNTLLDSTRIDGIELGHMSIPAMGVSGDYLDYIPFPKSVKIFLGDVSGHGVGSGYLVSAIKALVREQIRLEIGLNKLFEHLNNFLLQRHAGNQFMSLVGGEYYFEDSRFEFVNAGHLYPILLRREGSVEYLKTPDRVIGVLPTVFQKDSVTLETGDRLVIFSDGITETFSPAEEIFGIARLEKCIRECRHLNSFELITKIKSELDDYRKGASLTDDISIICLTKL
jgi:protein phosphatase